MLMGSSHTASTARTATSDLIPDASALNEVFESWLTSPIRMRHFVQRPDVSSADSAAPHSKQSDGSAVPMPLRALRVLGSSPH